MSAEVSQLRTTLLASLLDIARHNATRGGSALRLFEAGAVYLPAAAGELPSEPHHLAALLAGPRAAPTWRTPDPPAADFFSAKGVLEGLIARLGSELELEPASEPFLHPGRAARVIVGGNAVGWIGELHPRTAEAWELRGPVAAFELDLDAVPVAEPHSYEDLTSFPEVREDLAVIVADTVPAATVLATVRAAGAPLLAGAEVFDVYRDAGRLGEGQVSLALRLRYRAPDRTLTDEDVAAQRGRIVQALEAEHSGRVRDS